MLITWPWSLRAQVPYCSLCLLLTSTTMMSIIQAERAEKFYSVVQGLSPHVFISVLVTNSRHTLPNFLGYLEALDYPQDRISVWLRTDHNIDDTAAIVKYWCFRMKSVYKSVDCHASYKWQYPTSKPYSMSVQRSKNKARLRQQALEAALTVGADYLLTVDADCFLVNPRTIQLLMEQNKTIISPMLDAPDNLAYSNFWMAKDEFGNYVRDDIYIPIIRRERTGCFSAPLVFGVVFIHLATPYAENLVYHPPHPRFLGPVDDVKQFAFSAQSEGIGMHILNTGFFGYVMPVKEYKDINEASRDFFQFKLKTLVLHPPVLYSQYVKRQRPIIKNKMLGLDAIYVVNLARRPERRKRMMAILDELGYNYTIFNAVDGRTLNDSYLEDELGIRYMNTGLEEYYGNNRKMRKGQVGCFLSHYTIWRKVLEENLTTVLVMEDDVNFRSYFDRGLYHVLREANRFTPSWDFIYLGRHRVDRSGTEPRVPGTRWLVTPAHSYFMVCYLLTSRGARKLLDADPFHSLLATDEFINLRRGKPAKKGKKWLLEYPERDLNAYSAHPTIVEPTHFFGDKEHISDTAPPGEMAEIWNRIKEDKQIKVDESWREDIKKKSLQRQINKIKHKIMTKDEL